VDDTPALQTGDAPDVGKLGRQVMGAMIADPRKVPSGFGMGTAYRDAANKKPIYTLIVILGPANVRAAMPLIRQLEVLAQPAADVFDETELLGSADAPPPAPKKKRRKRRPRHYDKNKFGQRRLEQH